MRIKTLATDGLLFYTTSSDDMYAFSIAMVNGTIKVVNTAGLDSSGNPKRNELATVKAYNDGAWHHMSVVKESLVLRIVVDDNDYIDKESDHRGKKTKTAKEFGYYLGGLSQATVDSIVDRNNSATWQRFIGCMSDVFILNLLVDFSTSPETGYADYSTCPVEDPDDQPITTTAVTSKESLQPPTLAPIADPKPCVLPKKPDVENVVEQGTRFGLSEDSRYEFSTIAGFQTDIRKELRRNNNVRLQIKTFAMEGMIWFVGDFLDTSKETSSPDYSAIYLDKGKVVYKCNLGTGSGTATSQNAINDENGTLLKLTDKARTRLPVATF
ncbi:LAMA4 [Bugula neritina]|uniref:LAMA4 n=1 Tax=Bugula neritina TaxID=10212 RepID=A0A7J7JGA0_BUGNE|nr:LAMA4 [Bugula neritina]